MAAEAKRIAAFLRLAEEELRAAQMLARNAPRQSAYFCQQCAEKLARAILADAGVPFGPGHNLSQIAGALPDGHPWKSKINALDKHSPAATRFRYPSPTGRLFDPPAAEQLASDLSELESLLVEAKRHLAPRSTDTP